MIGNQTDIDYRYCQLEDLNSVYELLNENNLPVADLDLGKVRITVATINHYIVGCIGIEEYNTDGLLRSFAVLKHYRDKGIGEKLFRNLLDYCSQTGINTLHLLTDTAEEYFGQKGFSFSHREQAPDSIKDTSEFTELCPSTCAYMVKRVS
jgi:amino-acid N-acetyltransferase